MAQPQTEKGFVMIALDLFAALMAADLPNRECIVLAEVLSQCYGPRKAKSVHLDPASIEHYTGLHRNNARRAIQALERAMILQAEPDGSYRFNKDYESWMPAGRPMSERLGGGLLRFAMSTTSRHGVKVDAKARSARVAIQRDSDAQAEQASVAIQRDSSPKDFLNPTGFKSEGFPQSNGIDPHIKEHARLEKKKEEVRDTHTSPARDPDRWRIAEEITRDVFGLKELDGSADEIQTETVYWAIGQASEAAARSAALKAATKQQPMPYFLRMCNSGLTEPAAPSRPASDNGQPSRQTAEERRRALGAGLRERFKNWQPEEQ